MLVEKSNLPSNFLLISPLEIAPIEIKGKKGPQVISADEHPKPTTTLEVLKLIYCRHHLSGKYFRRCRNFPLSLQRMEQLTPETLLEYAMEQELLF